MGSIENTASLIDRLKTIQYKYNLTMYEALLKLYHTKSELSPEQRIKTIKQIEL